MDDKSAPPPSNYDAPPPSNYDAPPPYMGGNQGPPPNPGYPAANPGYPAANPGYPTANPGYPAAAAPGAPGYPQYPQHQQQQPYGQPPTSQTTVVVTQPGAMVVGGRMGPMPCTTNCPYCHASVTTATTRSCGGFVWMIAGIICLVGLFTMGITWLGCCLIPFCIPSLYDTTHTCPNCNRVIGEHTHF